MVEPERSQWTNWEMLMIDVFVRIAYGGGDAK